MAVAEQLGAQLRQACIVVNKSTVPVGTAERVEEIIRLGLARRRKRFPGGGGEQSGVPQGRLGGGRFQAPDRVIIGSAPRRRPGKPCASSYAPFLRNHERVPADGGAARLSSASTRPMPSLATKISFMNEMAGLCALTGVDIEDVRRGMGSDKAHRHPFHLRRLRLRRLELSQGRPRADPQRRATGLRQPDTACSGKRATLRQKELLFETLGELFQGRWQGRTVALWGWPSPGTDDLREAPSLVLLEALLRHGVRVRAHDPVANAGVAARYPDALACAQLTLHDSPYAAVEGADALVLVTEWKQFRQPDFQKIRGSMRTPLLVDGRNLYAPARMAELGFIYQGIGRPRAGH